MPQCDVSCSWEVLCFCMLFRTSILFDSSPSIMKSDSCNCLSLTNDDLKHQFHIQHQDIEIFFGIVVFILLASTAIELSTSMSFRFSTLTRTLHDLLYAVMGVWWPLQQDSATHPIYPKLTSLPSLATQIRREPRWTSFNSPYSCATQTAAADPLLWSSS